MSTLKAPAGATRLCPHCRAVILQSASTCPACKKHLKFEPGAASTPAPSFSALSLEGAVKHPDVGEAWEYSVLVSIKNEKGEEINRQVVGVGALQPGERRSFSFAVEVFVPSEGRAATPESETAVQTNGGRLPADRAAAPSVPSGTRPSGGPSVPSGTRPSGPSIPPGPSVPPATRPSPTPSVPSGTRPGQPSVPSGTRPRR